MTSVEFAALIAKMQDQGVAVVKFRGLNNVIPRLVWQEGHIEQAYASNAACEQKTTVVAEYMTSDEHDPAVEIIKGVFREARMPFVCEIGYDEQNDIISYLFNLHLSEEV